MHSMVLYKFIYLYYQSNNYYVNILIKTVILKRYILIFTLALISCAGTNYIHSISTEQSDEKEDHPIEDQLANIDIEISEDNTYVVIN